MALVGGGVSLPVRIDIVLDGRYGFVLFWRQCNAAA